MKKTSPFFLLSLFILCFASASNVQAQNAASTRRGAAGPGGAYAGNYGTAVQDVVVSNDGPMMDDGERLMILPYEIDPASPATIGARPVMRRVSAQAQEKRDERQAAREERRIQRETQLGSMNRSERAQERMSDVAKRVQEILSEREEKGGIGILVREIAHEQNEAQATLAANLNRLESRRGLVKWLFGTDRSTLLDLKKETTMIDQRIARLESGLDDLSEEDRERALDLIDDLKGQRTELLVGVEESENTFSVVGWFRRLFGQTN